MPKKKIQTPKHIDPSATADLYDSKPHGSECIEAGVSDDEGWKGIPDSDFDDLDHILAKAENISNSRSDEEAPNQLTKPTKQACSTM
jgi:hypothetical protein